MSTKEKQGTESIQKSLQNTSRRALLGLTSASFFLLAIGSRAKAHQGDTTEINNGLLKIESGPGQIVTANFAHHHHYLEIPIEYIQAPPNEGLEIHTGWAIFENKFASFGRHFHTVIISQGDLEAVRRGETVVIEDTVKDHKYVLRIQS